MDELHVDTFAAKTNIRDLLPRGSRVLEIGSYVGGFLETARRWGWTLRRAQATRAVLQYIGSR